MKDPPPKISFPDFRSGLVLGLFTFKQNSLLVPRLRRAGSEKRLLFVNSLAESGFVSREATTFDIFFSDEGSHQLKLNRASLAKQGAESVGRLFSTSCSSTCRSTCKLRDLKSPAPIPV